MFIYTFVYIHILYIKTKACLHMDMVLMGIEHMQVRTPFKFKSKPQFLLNRTMDSVSLKLRPQSTRAQ